MVLEYLAHAGYERAASALKVQIKERRAGKKSSWRPVGKDVRAHVKTRMMKALDRGERDEVLRLWENFVPPLVRRTDRNSQKLEFYLNIFFAIYPVHPANPSRKTSALALMLAASSASCVTLPAAYRAMNESVRRKARSAMPDVRARDGS